jgi:hypothetical protein
MPETSGAWSMYKVNGNAETVTDITAGIPVAVANLLGAFSYDRTKGRLLFQYVDIDDIPNGKGYIRTWAINLAGNGGLGAWAPLPLTGGEPRRGPITSSSGRKPLMYDSAMGCHYRIGTFDTIGFSLMKYIY